MLSEHVPAMIEHLEHVRKRPMMYMGETTERAVFAYLGGFEAACCALGFPVTHERYWQVCEERGWKVNSLGPQKRMRELGWSEQAIVEELLVIEIEVWKRVMESDVP